MCGSRRVAGWVFAGAVFLAAVPSAAAQYIPPPIQVPQIPQYQPVRRGPVHLPSGYEQPKEQPKPAGPKDNPAETAETMLDVFLYVSFVGGLLLAGAFVARKVIQSKTLDNPRSEALSDPWIAARLRGEELPGPAAPPPPSPRDVDGPLSQPAAAKPWASRVRTQG